MARADERADVVVAGGGIAGLAAALRLVRLLRGAARAPAIVLLERDRLGSGASGRGPGVATQGIVPDPDAARAEHGERAAVLEAQSLRGIERLHRTIGALGIRCGARRGASRRTLLRGDAGAADGSSGDDGTRAIDVAGDLVLEPTALIDGLGAAVRAAGVSVREGTPLDDVAAASGDGDLLRCATPRGTIAAPRVVLCLGAWLPGFDRWTAELAIAARAQWLATAPPAPPAASGPRSAPIAFTLGPGFAVARVAEDGRIIAGEGVQPSNRGEPFDATPPAADDPVQQRLEGWAASCFGRALPPVARRGAFPAAYTCDGLPLVGPHPGRAGVLLCGGFNGHDLAFGLVAGRAVAEIVVRGAPADRSLALWSPRRML